MNLPSFTAMVNRGIKSVSTLIPLSSSTHDTSLAELPLWLNLALAQVKILGEITSLHRFHLNFLNGVMHAGSTHAVSGLSTLTSAGDFYTFSLGPCHRHSQPSHSPHLPNPQQLHPALPSHLLSDLKADCSPTPSTPSCGNCHHCCPLEDAVS